MRFDRRSLQFRLAWRLVAVFVLAAVILAVGVILETRETVRSPEDWISRDWTEHSVPAEHHEEFAYEIVGDFLTGMAWWIPAVAGLTLVIGVFSLRRSLRPLREISAQAQRISPRQSDVRLDAEHLPSELVPLVSAVNQALDRLEAGMEQQRRFTANAAHQLRTPLAILTAELDVLEGDGKIDALREDAARMSRVVNQLLCMARLDSVALDTSRTVDLTATAAREVSALAPLALRRRCNLALEGSETRICIRGDADAIGDALRNLIENAIDHSPPGGEIIVSVRAPASIRVADQGPGVPADLRGRVFEQFWRGRTQRRAGAGLGLAIVRDILRAHGGTVSVVDNTGGGAVFILQFGRGTGYEIDGREQRE